MSTLLDLEANIKALPGVLGCVIMTDPDGKATEIQAFVRVGVDPVQMQMAVREEASKLGVDPVPRNVFVFELDAESQFGDRESLERAAQMAEQDARARGPSEIEAARDRAAEVQAEAHQRARRPTRPLVSRVVLTSSSWTSESEVELRLEDEEIVGQAEGEKTPHGLKVLAQATLDAAHKLTGSTYQLEAASLVNISGREAVLVLVRAPEGLDNLGAALVRGAPVHEVAVRATLSAINRRMTQDLGG